MNSKKKILKVVLVVFSALLIVGGIFSWLSTVSSPTVQQLLPTINPQTYNFERFGLRLALPLEFRALEDDSPNPITFVRGEGQNASIFKVGKISDSSASFEQQIIKSVTFDPSGLHPKSINEFSKIKLGNNEFYSIRAGLFEGVLTMDYFLVIPSGIYKFEVVSRGVDWTNPNFKPEDESNIKTAEGVLKTLSVVN